MKAIDVSELIQEGIAALIDEENIDAKDLDIQTYSDAGVLTSDDGLLIRNTRTDEQFQITIVACQ